MDDRLRESLNSVRTQVNPLRAKVNRGQRLSAREQQILTRALESAVALRDLATMANGYAKRYRAFESWLTGADGAGEQFWYESSTAHESRAVGEGTSGNGLELVPARFNDDVIRYMREYDSILSALEVWNSPDGNPYKRAAYSEFSAAATDTENTAFTEGPYPTFAQQSWGDAQTFAASARLSNQLVQDSFRVSTAQSVGSADGMASFLDDITPDPRLGALVAASLAESLGRALAPVAATAVYAGINTTGAITDSGGYLALGTATALHTAGGATTELALGTIGLDTAAQMIAGIDEAYLPNCKFYMNRKQWTGILRLVDGQGLPLTQVSVADKTLMGFPVVLSSQTSAATASTVSGPIFGDLESAFTLRIVNDSLAVMRSIERFAEDLETYFRSTLRADVQVRDARAVVGVKYATT